MTRLCQYDTFCSMGKKKKTKREKIISDLKKQLSQAQSAPQSVPLQKEQPNSPRYSLDIPVTQVQKVYQKEKPKKDYSYVSYDVKRTLAVVASILIINSTIYLLVQNNIVHIALFGL